MEKKAKLIEAILAPPPPHWVGDGFRVHNFFPSGYSLELDRMSPFFLLDYNSKVEYEPTSHQRGVGKHPHRGFETVSIAYHGRIAHHDNAGNSGVIGEGDMQWMTAGSGILHQEYHDKTYSEKGGPFQMVQLWVNLPAKYKMTPPKYQGITNAEINKHYIPNGGGWVEVLAGSFKGTKGAASSFTPLEMYNIKLEAMAEMSFDLPEHYNTGLLLIEGSVLVNGSEVTVDHFVLFENKGTEISISAKEKSVILVLSGEGIDEPIYPYGPFLMNTKEEIIQAYEDLKAGKFGV